MANNFHYAATAYRVFADATHGNDSWDGLTPDTPKKTLNGVRLIMNSTRYQAIITGYFLNQLCGIINNYEFIGDGLTVIEYSNNSTAIFNGNVNNSLTVRNVLLKNIKLLTDNKYPAFTNCYFLNVKLGDWTVSSNNFYNLYLNSCTLYNCFSNSFTSNFSGSKFFNSYISITDQPYVAPTVSRCYFNKSCLLRVGVFGLNGFHNYIGTFNNYECKFKYISTYYDDLASFTAAYPVLNDTEGNKNLPVTFNNFAAGDFSVPADSPLLDTSKWNASVCGNATKGQGVYFSEGAANWTISQTDGTNDIEIVSNEVKLASGKTVGTITRNAAAPIDIGSLQTLKKINYLGLISFANGTGNNIPAINSYTIGQKGYSPVRMTIALKTSPISLAEAEWNAMSWKEFDLLETPRTDGVNESGHPDFDYLLPAWSGNIQARYFLVKITLRTTV